MCAAQEGEVWESGIVEASDDLEFELEGKREEGWEVLGGWAS